MCVCVDVNRARASRLAECPLTRGLRTCYLISLGVNLLTDQEFDTLGGAISVEDDARLEFKISTYYTKK